MALGFDFYFYLSSWIIFQCYWCFGSLTEHSYLVTFSDCVLLKSCYHESDISNSWKFKNESIFVDNLYFPNQYHKGMKINVNGSVFITSVTLNNEGTYVCIREGNTSLFHHLHVKGL